MDDGLNASTDGTDIYIDAASMLVRVSDDAEEGKLSEEVILSIMQEEKPNQKEQFRMPRERISKYFPAGTPAQKIEDTIIKALELYQRQRSRDRER